MTRTTPASGSGKGDAGKPAPPATRLIRALIMMPEYGHALLCTALWRGAAAVRLPAVGRGARRRADDGVGRGVRTAAVYLCVARARFSCWCTPLWLTTSPWPMSPATRTRSCRCGTGVAATGREARAAAVGAADERLDLAVAVFGGRCRRISSPGAGGDGDGLRRFLAFILFTSGPFARARCRPFRWRRDLNPLLQDPG